MKAMVTEKRMSLPHISGSITLKGLQENNAIKNDTRSTVKAPLSMFLTYCRVWTTLSG